MQTLTSGGVRVPEPEPADDWGRRLKAERDALLELIAIFTHDLSNPLQSLTVLCELGVDEAPPGSEDHLRNEQCLEAAIRMRQLIHGLAGITRRGDSGQVVQAVVERVWSVLCRRFERNRIEAKHQTEEIDALVPPEGIEFALINLGLGAVTATADAGRGPHRLQLTGHALPSGRARVGVRITTGADERPLTIGGAHRKRVDAYLETVAGARFVDDDGGAFIEFEPSSAS